MGWASHRRVLYAVGAGIALLIILSVPIYKIAAVPPSCTDGKQNGDEQGVDCGGACALICPALARKPIVHWARMFKVSDGVYDAAAYVENPNTDARTREAIYRFKAYDSDNILILERLGKTRMEAGEVFAIFLGGIKTGEREPRRIFFEFEPDMAFERAERREAPLVAVSTLLQNTYENPRLSSKLKNRTALIVRGIDVVAILYAGENAVTASATHIDEIKGNGEEEAVFTWPRPIEGTITRIEIIPRPRESIAR